MPSIQNHSQGLSGRFVPAAALAIVIAAVVGCASITYTPGLSLQESERTVPARVRVVQFSDETPEEDRKNKVAGVSATAPDSLAGELATHVTNALVSDFSINGVFTEIGKKTEDPDLIMKGSIRRFYGKAGANELYWVTLPIDIIWLFGLRILSDEGAVSIDLSFETPAGESVASYQAASEFSKNYSMYTNPVLGIGTRLNTAFDEAVSDLRRQILEDSENLER